MTRDIKFQYIVIGSCGNVMIEVFPLHDIEKGYAMKWLQTNTIRGDIHKRQFTGLQDKNGVDIYEGDILGETRLLHDGPCYCTVEVKYVAPSFKVRDLALSSYMGIEWEVIGNKFESPELLEK